MAVILTPDKWRRQPTGSVILSPSCDLTADAGFIIVPGPGGGLVDIAPASRSASRFTDSAVSPTPIGIGATGGSQITRVSGKKLEFPLTFFWLVWADLNATSVYYRSGLHVDDSRTITVDLQEYGARINYSYNWADDGGVVVGSVGTANRAGAYLLVATISHAQRALYVFDGRGRLEGSGTNSVDSSANDSYLTSGWKHRGGGTSAIKSLLAGYVPRQWSDSEIREFAKNPWQIFRKQPRILYFNTAGGGATITGDSGSYTLTGTAATLKAGRKLAADSGTYNLTGTAATLKVGRKLTADSGTYTLTGTAVAFKRGYALGADSGTYTVSGTTVNLKAGRKLTADSGSYTLTGTDATLNYSPAGSYNLTAESGTYTLTGTAATLKVSRKLTADSGAYTLTGTDVTLSKGVKLTADSGSYTLTGSNVAFARTYVLTAESGAYTLTGTSAGLTWSGAPVVEVPTNGGPSIYGKPVFREKQFRKEYDEQVKRIEDEKRLARILREDEEITVIMALMAA